MKYKVGDSVTTIRGFKPKISGLIKEIIYPSKDVQMLWGTDELHYRVENKLGESLNIIERGLEYSENKDRSGFNRFVRK